MRSRQPNKPDRGPSRHTMQLCSQVERELAYIFGECHDDVIQGLYVQQVQPAPDASRLLVTVMPMDPAITPIQAIEHLATASSFIRSEIAQSIHRKRAPELTFNCLPSVK